MSENNADYKNQGEPDKQEEPDKPERPAGSYTKGQRIAALVMVVLLVAMYMITLVAAITTSPAAPELFKMSLGASLLLPIMLWLYIRFAKLFMNRDK